MKYEYKFEMVSFYLADVDKHIIDKEEEYTKTLSRSIEAASKEGYEYLHPIRASSVTYKTDYREHGETKSRFAEFADVMLVFRREK